MEFKITSTDDIHDALRDKGIDRCACAACGQRTWTLIEKPIGFRDLGRESFRTVALSCTNCGYLRFHVAETLLVSN